MTRRVDVLVQRLGLEEPNDCCMASGRDCPELI